MDHDANIGIVITYDDVSKILELGLIIMLTGSLD